MRTSRLTALLAVLVFGSTLTYAGPVDPRIVIAGDSGSTGVGLFFSFSANELGGGHFALSNNDTGFFNNSGENWNALGIKVPLAYSGGEVIPYSVDNYQIDAFHFFDYFSVDRTAIPEWLVISFWNNCEGECGGIGIGAHFSIDLRDLCAELPCSDGHGGWLDASNHPLTFYAAGNPTDEWLSAPVPEPGSLVLLLLGGLGVLVVGIAWRKR